MPAEEPSATASWSASYSCRRDWPSCSRYSPLCAARDGRRTIRCGISRSAHRRPGSQMPASEQHVGFAARPAAACDCPHLQQAIQRLQLAGNPGFILPSRRHTLQTARQRQASSCARGPPHGCLQQDAAAFGDRWPRHAPVQRLVAINWPQPGCCLACRKRCARPTTVSTANMPMYVWVAFSRLQTRW